MNTLTIILAPIVLVAILVLWFSRGTRRSFQLDSATRDLGIAAQKLKLLTGGDILTAPHINVVHRGLHIKIIGDANDDVTVFEVVRPASNLGLGLRVISADFSCDVHKPLGVSPVTTGDQTFDQTFVLEAIHPRRAAAILNGDVRQQLHKLQERCHELQLTDHRLHVRWKGLIDTSEALHHSLNIQTHLMDLLEQALLEDLPNAPQHRT